MKWLAYNFVAICLIGVAVYLIYLDRSGWGWLIFAALLAVVLPSDKDNKE